jgi:hypothetical protein
MSHAKPVAVTVLPVSRQRMMWPQSLSGRGLVEYCRRATVQGTRLGRDALEADAASCFGWDEPLMRYCRW